MMRKKSHFLFLVLLLFVTKANAQVVLSSAPVFSKQESETLFQPLADKIGKILEIEISYQHPKDWSTYGREMQKGMFDILVDQPHFAQWRTSITSRLDHLMIAVFPGTKRYAVISKQTNAIYGLEDLVGKRICAKPSPEISTMVVLSQYRNPVQQPTIFEMNKSPKETLDKLRKNRCYGAIIPYEYFENLDQEKKVGLGVYYLSPEIPNMVISISRKIKKEDAQKLKAAFLAGELDAELKPLMDKFSPGEKPKLLPLKKGDLDMTKNMLRGVLWGW